MSRDFCGFTMVFLSGVSLFPKCWVCLTQLYICRLSLSWLLVYREWHLCLDLFWCWPCYWNYQHLLNPPKFQARPVLLAGNETQEKYGGGSCWYSDSECSNMVLGVSVQLIRSIPVSWNDKCNVIWHYSPCHHPNEHIQYSLKEHWDHC